MILSSIAKLGDSQYNAEKPSESMGKEDFLKLLITQLKNQDPLDPMESTEFAAQLAQFSSVEQLTNVNSKLEEMLQYSGSLNNAQAIGLMGKTVRASGDTVALQEGTGVDLCYTLSQAASDVTINIYDENGKLVKSQIIGGQEEGSRSYAWDGTDAQGNRCAAGNYRFEVKAKDGQGNGINVTTLLEGVITGVDFRNGMAYLQINGTFVSAGEVISVLDKSSAVPGGQT